MPHSPVIPTLPQQDGPEQQQKRAFDLTLARTEYNYMRSYLEGVPLSADLPSEEKFSLDFEAQVLAVIKPMMKNFSEVVLGLLKRELESDLPKNAIEEVRTSFAKLESEFSIFHPSRDVKDLKEFLRALAALPKALEGLFRIPQDLAKMAKGIEEVFADFLQNGPTAFLKSTLWDMLNEKPNHDFLLAKSESDYQELFASLRLPLMLTLPTQPWMPKGDDKPCEQDWFFGYLQLAGFNTTNLRGVVEQRSTGSHAIVLSELQRKMPISDTLLQKVTGNSTLTLAQAVREQRLYAVDFAQFEGATADMLHGQQRYITAPIAVFYWNSDSPAGFPPPATANSGSGPGAGVLQPIAIQLAQAFDAENAPIFTPNNVSNANDPSLMKWRIAKYIVNVLNAIQHEAIAHLGDCHLIIEPIVVASHRQLSKQHPLLKLLIPHFRFTININDDAIHSLIIPGGVVATNVGPAIECTRQLISEAHRQWRWDENNPDQVFSLRGVDAIPAFPFRDDTRLLWQATRRFVSSYLRLYYHSDADVRADSELQGWIKELTAPQYCGFKGLNGLSRGPDGSEQLDSLDYLIQMVSYIIYLAGPQHASVNYAQYPLMSYMPSVAGTIYRAPPTRSTVVATRNDCLPWYPPLDVALYTFSFEYLLSNVQYDTFGHYDKNIRDPYFEDPRVLPLVADFQQELSLIEIDIRKRNQSRPMPYPFQLPSMIPNSISI